MSILLRRREFIATLGGAAAWSLAARAQQMALPVIGYLSAGSPEQSQINLTLAEVGFAEGKNAAIEFRLASRHRSTARVSGRPRAPPSGGHCCSW